MNHPQLLALAQMLESGETLISPKSYFEMRLGFDRLDRQSIVEGPPLLHTEAGPVRITVVRALPEGVLMPGDGQGQPLLAVPSSFPVDGPPADWPKDWLVVLSDYRYMIQRGQL